MARAKVTAIKAMVVRVMAKEDINPIKVKKAKVARTVKEIGTTTDLNLRREEGDPKEGTGAITDLILSHKREPEDVRHQELKTQECAITPRRINVKQETNAIFGTHRN